MIRRPSRRSPRHTTPLTTLVSLCVLFLCTGASAGEVEDPFSPGLRWSRESASAPWIPGHVQFADGDQLVWAASAPFGAAGARVESLSAWGSGPQPSLASDAAFTDGARILELASSRNAAALFALVQTPGAGAAPTSVYLARYPAPGPASDPTDGPLWTIHSPAAVTGAARIACDVWGESVCFAAWDSQSKRILVRWHRGDDGSIFAATEVIASDLDRLVMSADGAFTLAASGDRVWIWDASGALFHYEITDGPVRVADFDASGDRLLIAHGARARLLERVAGGYLESARVDAAPNELAGCGAMAASGGGWAIAWYDLSTGDARYQLFAGATTTVAADHAQVAITRTLQNIPASISITPDAQRVAFGTWGSEAAHEVLLLGAANGGLVWSIDLPGSALDVDLDHTGRRIVVAHKNTHANLPSSGGAVRMYDSGESDLTLTQAPREGGVLALEALVPGASVAFFLFGAGVDTPAQLPFVSGELWVSLHSRLVVRARRPDAEGIARCELDLPHGLSGVEIATQAVARQGGSLVASETHIGVRPR